MTDKTEAVEKLAALFEDYTEQERSTGFCTTDWKGFLAAIQADLIGYFPPKPLEWVKDIYGWKANPADPYFIADPNMTGTDLFALRLGPPLHYRIAENFPTLEAAQAAAEIHRIEMLAKEFVR